MFRSLRIALMVVPLALIVVSGSVAAVALPDSSPIPVAINTGTPFFGAGFHPGEIISLEDRTGRDGRADR